jgi:hypothetical protein
MRVAPLLLAAASAAFVSVLVAACGEPPPAAIGLVLKSEQGILDEASSVGLRVFDGDATACEDDGSAGDIPEEAQSFQLTNVGCEGGATWCGEIELDRDDKSKVFYVDVQGPNGLLGQGCGAAKIDQDPVTVDITVIRYVLPGCCNDGTLQAGEQCDSGQPSPNACADGGAGGECKGVVADAVCNCDCTTKPIPVDRRTDGPAAAPDTKSDLVIAFSRGEAELSNALRCAFTDVANGTVGGGDVAVRYLDADTAPFDPIENNDVADPLFVPLSCDAPDAAGSGRRQRNPAIANVSSDSTALVYLSDEAEVNTFEGYLVNLGPEGCAEDEPVVFSGDGAIDNVDIAAGPTGIALIVFGQDGAVKGRFWGEDTGFGEVFDIAASGGSPRVAGSALGWAVAYTSASPDADGVTARTVSLVANMPNVGPEIAVNDVTQGPQDQPDIAMLPDGRFAVAWRSGGDIYAQHFSAGGTKSEGDQAEPTNTSVDGEQATPVIESSGATGSFYVVAWSDAASGEIRSRFLGDVRGYLFNSVTGQNDEFLASPIGQIGTRSKPAISVGGNASVAIGWQDSNPGNAGVHVRRFPLPAAQ